MRHESGLQTFVRALLAGGVAGRRGDAYSLDCGLAAEAHVVAGLIEEGILSGDETECRANAGTRA